ncbi:calcium-activated potassium channel [Schistosoma mansoni]|uniref:calcium-activated potassium channel n=1 Tax=Schistosoma mansoni TaxID=6183 RepID=UPI00019B3793|nr:calcium-activated potassium channel [Schistosoma mansoni]|eukprot:XP_018646098.1 calcium-activated potassium channel [Schistosoma mansoni]
MDEKVKELEDDEEEEEEKEEGRKEQTTENKSEYSSEIQKAPHSILDDYDLRGFKRFSYLFHHQPSTETDSFEMFQSVSSTKFLENLDDFKHSTSGSWKSVISSFEDVNTTNNSNNHKNNHHQTPEASSYSSKSMEAKSNIDNSSHTTMNAQLKQEPQMDDLQNVKEHLDDSFKSLSNTSKDNSSRISYPDVTMHKTDSLDNVTRRFEVRKHSKSSLLSNNQFRRTKFLKQKYADPNNNHNDDHDHDSTDGIPRSSSKLKRTATEHITNRYKYHDRTESSSIHHPNDNIPVNPIMIRRKSTIHCLYPRHYSDAMKQDECLNSQTMIYEDINKNDKYSMMGMVNPNSSHSNNIPEFDTHLNEYRLSEDLKSSFEKEDEMKADNLLEREAHIGALALAWASGTHKSKKSPYDKYSLNRETSDRVPVKLRQHNNNNNHNYNHHHSRSTVISPDNFRFNNYTTNNNMSSKNRMTLSTLRELSTSIFTPSKRNLITSSIHHQNATHRQKACYPIDETDRLHHDEKNIPITTTTTTTQNNNSSISSSHKNKTDHHLIPQSIKHAIIRNTAKIAISPILHTNEENDNDEHLHTFKPSNEHSCDSIESDQLEQFNRKDDHLHESHPTEEPPPYRQQHQQSEELRKLVDNGSQLILHSQKSSLQSEQLHDINGIFETNDNDETNRPIGIRAKIRRNAEDLRSLYGTSGPLGSVQPQMNYRSSSRGIGWRLHWRKIFNERRRKLADYSLFFAVMGILLMVFELEMIMAKVYLRTSIYSILIKSLISASTLILVGLTLVYHAVDVQLFCINNCIEDWRIAMNCRKISLTLIEVFICLIHPPPILSNYNIYSYRNSYYTLSTLGKLIFSVPMFLRLYLIFRVLLLHSTMFTDAGSRSIGALNRVKINVRFVLKTLATICPGTMLLIFILSMWIVTSWIMRVCEREQNKEYEKLLNSMWLIAVTFLSIGYGDMVPNTNCGRAISVLAGVMGSACTALVVAVVARKLELTRAEKHVHNFMQDNKFYKNLRHSAANVLRETWLFYKYTRLVKRVKPGRVRRHQRKFLTAISRLRKAKDNQRKLKEDANSMVDLAKSYINQMSDTFTGIIETFGTCNNIATISLEDETTSSNMNVTT